MTVYRLAPWVLLCLVWSWSAAPASAQPDRPRGGGFGPRMVLSDLVATQKSVQEELKLSDEQIEKAKQLSEEGRTARREARDLSGEEQQKKMQEVSEASDKKLAESLGPEKFKRVKQIGWQVSGPGAFVNPEVVKALDLTSEQKQKIDTVLRETGESMRGLLQADNPDSARKEFMKLREIGFEKAHAVLTDEQKTKWKELAGEPFKGEIELPRPGRGGRNRS